MRVDFRSNIREVVGWMEDFKTEQIPFAVAKALTDTAKDVAGAETLEISKVFDKPTPFTRRAVGFTPARKTNLTSVIFLKDAQARYLISEIDGGKRDAKRFEQKFGAISGAAIAVPGAGATVNQYGNVSRAQILKLARDLNSSGEHTRLFKGTPPGSSLPPGIYARVDNNTKIVPVLVFAQSATYKRRFEFSELAEQTVNDKFLRNLSAAWDLALRSAR